MAGMTKYRTTGAVTFGAGAVLGLSDSQAAARVASLVALGKGVYRAQQPVQFKAGEELAVDGRLPKALADDLDAVATAQKAKSVADEKTFLDKA